MKVYYSDDDNGNLITGYSIGTVTVTITDPSGTTSSWSHAFNSNNIGPGASNECAYVIVTPSISFSNSYSGTFTVSITEKEAIQEIKNLSTIILGGIIGITTVVLIIAMYFGGML